jgi:hypothetical protein
MSDKLLRTGIYYGKSVDVFENHEIRTKLNGNLFFPSNNDYDLASDEFVFEMCDQL